MRPTTSAAMAERLESVLLPGCVAAIAFATLALGATPPWAWAATELVVLALLAVWLAASALRGEISLRLPRLAFPMLAILLLVFLQAYARLSVYPPATRQAAWMLFVVGGFFLLLHNQLSSESKLEAFVTVLLYFGFVVAIFSIVQKLSFNGKVYWFWAPHQAGEIFGPFIKRNDYAAWALMLVPLAWIRAGRRREPPEVRIFWALVVLVLGISILFSLSRAGSVLFFLFFPLYALLGRSPERSSRAALAVALGVILVAAVATVGLDTGRLLTRWQALAEMFSHTESVELYRWQMWRDTLAMIRDHLWLGSGMETFIVLSDSYRTFDSTLRWNHAHNEYLEWLAETGLVGGGLALWFLVTLARTVEEKMRLTRESRTRQLVVGAALGCLLVLLHSLVDFPLRIPANMLLFAALWAVITAPATGAVLNQRPSGPPGEVGTAEFRLR